MTNEELLRAADEMIQKGVITTGDIASSGKLNPQQANKFIDFVIDESVLRGKVRFARLKGEQTDIDKIGVSGRVAVAKVEATDPGVRRTVSTTKVSMTPKQVMVPFEISDEFGIENIEGESASDHIVRMMATQFVNDLEELGIDGNTLGQAVIENTVVEGGSATDYIKDGFLALQDGYMKLAGGGNLVDAAGANISTQLLSNMINAMPTKFRRNRGKLRFLCPPNIEQNYRMRVSTRATAQGDVALNNNNDLTPFGIPLVPIPFINENPIITEHLSLPGTTAVQLLNTNLVPGGEAVFDDDLALVATTKYIEDTDYNMVNAAGTIARDAGGALSDPHAVKISYTALSQMLLTEYRNLIMGIGKDIRIERDRDIYKSVNQFAMTIRIAMTIENLEALVLLKNLGTG